MDIQLAYAMLAVFGGVCGVLVPYWIKAWQSKEIEFDFAYAYGLLVQVIVAAVALVPDVTVWKWKVAFTVFTAGVGLQSAINKAVSFKKGR